VGVDDAAVMGVFRIPADFANPEGTRHIVVEALVDTGATVCQLPRRLAASIGLAPSTRRRFRLASGELVEREVADIRVSLLGDSTRCDCAIGDDAAEIILGSVALEQMGLAVDPGGQQLIPGTMWLLAQA